MEGVAVIWKLVKALFWARAQANAKVFEGRYGFGSQPSSSEKLFVTNSNLN